MEHEQGIGKPPRIAPLPAGSSRPFWSVMIPAYNATEYLRETLQSVLCQDRGADEMQIEVVDNCSTIGDPERLVRELSDGRVRFYRQPKNVGPIENFNTCIRRARGEWIHILHSDDKVLPGFYSRAWDGLFVSPAIGAALCRIVHVDANGDRAYYSRDQYLSELEAPQRGLLGRDFVRNLFIQQRIQFVGIVVRRSIYETVGGFRPELVHCADWDMWIRIALVTQILYEPEPFACYRLHAGADSTKQTRTGQNVADQRRAIRLAATYVPAAQARENYPAAMRAASVEAIARARRLWAKGERTVALRQLWEAVRCSLAVGVILRLVLFLPYALGNLNQASDATATSTKSAQ